MRTRSLSFYSLEDFNERLSKDQSDFAHSLSESNPNTNSSFGSDLSKSTEIEDISHENEELDDVINNLNQNYKKNISLFYKDMNLQSKEIIIKCIKEIVSNRYSILFNNKKRISSFDSNDKYKKISFRKLIYCICERKLLNLFTENLLSTSYVNVLILSNFPERKFKLKFNIHYSSGKNFFFSYENKLHFPLVIQTQRIFLTNTVKQLKFFDIDHNLSLLYLYAKLSQVILFIIDGENKSSIDFLQRYSNNFTQLKFTIEIKPTTVLCRDFCFREGILYQESKNQNNIRVNEIFLRGLLLNEQSLLKKEDYYNEGNFNIYSKYEDNYDEFDCLQRGTNYRITFKIPDINKKKNAKIFNCKKMSEDSICHSLTKGNSTFNSK